MRWRKPRIIYDPNVFRANPGAQASFKDDRTHRYCALAGGWFAGKTWAGARKLVHLHLHNAFDDRGRRTGVKSAVIAPTYQLANDVDIPELRRAMDEMDLQYKFLADPKRFCFILPTLGTPREPSEILIRSADRPDRITGWTVGAIWGDEAARWKSDRYNPQNDPFIQADARLRDPRARFLQFMVTFTHEGDDTRVYRDFELEPKLDHVLYRAATVDNPHARAFAEVQRQQLSGDLASQYLEGIACSTAGQRMYASFDPARNVTDSLASSRSHPLQLSVDFNIDPGMHAILGQHLRTPEAQRVSEDTTTAHTEARRVSEGLLPESPLAYASGSHDDLLTALHELHEPRMSVKRLVTSLRTLLDSTYPDHVSTHLPLQIFGDSTGGNQWAGAGESCYDVLSESLRHHGIPHVLRVPRTNPHVADRVNAVNCALADAAGHARYLIHPRCRRLIDDLRTMRWATTGEADKRDRLRSHASDAEGYRVHYLLPIRRPYTLGGQIGVHGS